MERAALPPGSALIGPAVITEDETSIIVPSGFSSVRQSDGCIEITRTAPRPAEDMP